MGFTMRQPERSCHPETLLRGTRARWWSPPAATRGRSRRSRPTSPRGRMPRYTRRDEYAALRERAGRAGRPPAGSWRPGRGSRCYVDSNHHVDREAAARAGIAVYGKNTLAITRRHGSWVVLGVLVTDAELEPTHAAAGRAGVGCVRVVPRLHRRLPDRRDRRRRRARRPAAACRGSRSRAWPSCPPAARSATACTAATSARTCARGTRAPSAAPPGSSRMPSTTPTRRCASGSRPTPTSSPSATGGCTCPTATAATCSETRASRSRTSAGDGHGARSCGAAAPRTRPPGSRTTAGSSTSAWPR